MADNGWAEYQKLVLAELKRLDAGLTNLQRDVTEIRLCVAVLRTRAVTWGAVGGIVMWTIGLVYSAWTSSGP
jgi:hypothetical protein|tara:strand:- start:20 stop:235 length:216 start_codon:yes stop_codon:yes gene_type:complete